RCSPNGSSPRMSRGTSIWDLPRSRTAYRPWAITQRRACSQRAKRAQATGVAACSSWPTPTARDCGHFADLMVGAGSVQPVKTLNLGPASSGQIPLSNASRQWTLLWLILRSAGWRAATMASHSLHPVRVTFGRGSSTGTLICNPRFYEHVMGWPIGWTAPEAQVTGFAAWLRQSRGALSKLILPTNGQANGQEATNDAV
ncbi:MAG: hypothetical protein ABL874_11005, partial [Sphingopyxis sp.]